MYILKAYILFKENLTKIGQPWEYPNKITRLQNHRWPDKMTKSLTQAGGWGGIRLATDFSIATFSDKSHWNKI